MTDTSNDNLAYLPDARPPEPDAHGQAALLLIETLMHCLVERSVITVETAIEIAETAAEVKAEIAADLGESPETADRSISMLIAIADSLRHDAS